MRTAEEVSRYTSVYLDAESRDMLSALAESTGQSRSQVIRNLIKGADGSRDVVLAGLVGEMADLLHVR